MRIGEALKNVTLLGLDTSPLIYFVETTPAYIENMRVVFRQIDAGLFTGVTSTITLTEVLTKPRRLGDVELENTYRKILQQTQNIVMFPVVSGIAERAADLRARYNLKTPDALQIATALDAGCEAFLTNDAGWQRVAELRVLIVSELE